ncbi:hypothetical protein IFM89_016250 [Coptis chinensis]|uniref:Mitochondrial import inner membrane translocase subunit TIM50 n=1 Tax=Coptis chinensis TaxID=261450 RepID=A0A835I0H2_9MAGN|nr:hypothetical protein IFM89_016250 [Coptis chinensis]
MKIFKKLRTHYDQRVFANDGVANTPALAEYHGELQDVVDNTAQHDFMTLADGVNMLLQNPDDIIHPPEDAASFENPSPQQFVGTTSVDHLEPTTTTHSTMSPQLNIGPDGQNAPVEIEDTTIDEDLDVNITDGKNDCGLEKMWTDISSILEEGNSVPASVVQATKRFNSEEREAMLYFVEMTIAKDLLDCGITERQFLSKKEDVQSRCKEGMVIHRPPMSKTNRILLILDLNGVLVHANKLDLPLGFKADTFISRKAIIRRPFCDDFLKFCFERFYVGVWSSRKKLNLVRLLKKVPVGILLGPIPLHYH